MTYIRTTDRDTIHIAGLRPGDDVQVSMRAVRRKKSRKVRRGVYEIRVEAPGHVRASVEPVVDETTMD